MAIILTYQKIKIMNKKFATAIIFSLMLTMFYSCLKPRISLNAGQWGDKAQITGVNIFRYKQVSNLLNYQDTVTGFQFVTIKSIVTIDDSAYKVNIITDLGTDLSAIGIRISNFAEKIEPQNGAPTAGYISDFSKGPYIYKLFSSDGTIRDWTLSFSVSPTKL
jgi:hypothetical protein